jgi:hypothetical protein
MSVVAVFTLIRAKTQNQPYYFLSTASRKDFSNFHWDKIIPLQHLNISGYFSQFNTTVAKKKKKSDLFLKFY